MMGQNKYKKRVIKKHNSVGTKLNRYADACRRGSRAIMEANGIYIPSYMLCCIKSYMRILYSKRININSKRLLHTLYVGRPVKGRKK